MINCKKPQPPKIVGYLMEKPPNILVEWEGFPEAFSLSPTTLHVSVLYD